MKKSLRNNRWGFLLILVLLQLSFACNKDDENAEPNIERVVCSANCNSMDWSIVDESGPHSTEQSCSRQYVGNSYRETCNGKVTYSNSGKTYNFIATYDWVNCKISIDVTGVGSCSSE
ncbi:MAG: hypothetical protein H6573_00470 [Lewinellaceae bacterium]|nr:hypothetical protein [Phaeodactylibacter sp.]MCB9345971.1 hypothetical protein [Lewinellaceae bacterium]